MIKVCALHDLVFRFKASNGEERAIQVTSLSPQTVGFLKRGLRQDLGDEITLNGVLEFEQLKKKFTLELQLSGIEGRVMLFTVANPEIEFLSIMDDYFKYELSAHEMVLMSPKLLKKEADGTPFSYEGSHHCSLYMVVNEEEKTVVRFNITLFGNYLEGGHGRPLRYGKVVEDDQENDKASFKGSERIHYENFVPIDMTFTISKFLLNIPELDPGYRFQLGTFLSEGMKT